MANTPKDVESDLESLKADIAALRKDLAGLVGNAASGLSQDAAETAAAAQESVGRIYRDAAKKSKKVGSLIETELEERPVLAILVVLAVAYAAGRLLSK